MAWERIFRWEDAPLPYRLLLAHGTGDSTPRTHLALVPQKHRARWGENPPVNWTDLLRMEIENIEGLEGVMPGDELVAGNEIPPPSPREPGQVEVLRPESES